MLIQHTLTDQNVQLSESSSIARNKITSQSCSLRDRAGSKEKKKSELWIRGVGSAPTRVSVQWRMTNENHPHNGSMDCPAALYVAWKRGLPRKFACFLLFHLIKKRSLISCVFWICCQTCLILSYHHRGTGGILIRPFLWCMFPWIPYSVPWDAV